MIIALILKKIFKLGISKNSYRYSHELTLAHILGMKLFFLLKCIIFDLYQDSVFLKRNYLFQKSKKIKRILNSKNKIHFDKIN